MEPHGWIALITLIAATTLFITRWLPLPVTALSIPVVLVSTGVLAPDDALMGFGNNAVIAIGAIFVIGMGLRESGVATLTARGLQRVAGRNEFVIVIMLMTATALLAAFMNNTAVVAILLPVGVVLARRSNTASSRILMPLSFAAVLGGTISLIGTAPNFLAADFYNDPKNVEKYGFDGVMAVFDYAKVGIPITITGILFMAIFGRRLLPTITTADRLAAAALPEDAASNYGVAENLFTVRIARVSGLAGKTLAESNIRKTYKVQVLMVRRPTALAPKWMQPDPDLRFEPDDVVFVSGDHEHVWDLCEEELLQFGLADAQQVERILARGATMAEVAIAPHSAALGKSFKEIDFRKRFGLNVLALFRGQEVHREELADLPLQMGDAFLVSGTPKQVRAFTQNRDFTVLTDQTQAEDVTRAPLALAIFLLALIPPVFFAYPPLPVTALGGAMLMIVTRCISRSGLRRCMDWNVLCLIIGTLPLGLALYETGIAGSVASGLTSVLQTQTSLFAALFVLAAVFSILASNAAAAVIVAPVAVQSALDLGVDPKLALLAMAYGCSCNFIVPHSQCNLLVLAPGGYRGWDFVKAGIPMSIVMGITTIVTLAFL